MTEMSQQEAGLLLAEVRRAWAEATEEARNRWPFSAPREAAEPLLEMLRGFVRKAILSQAKRRGLAVEPLMDSCDEIAEKALQNLSHRSVPEDEACRWVGYINRAAVCALRDHLRKLTRSPRVPDEPPHSPETDHEADTLRELEPLREFVRKVSSRARAGNRREAQFDELCRLFLGSVTWEELETEYLVASGEPDNEHSRKRARAALQTGHTAFRKTIIRELLHLLKKVKGLFQASSSPVDRSRHESEMMRYERWITIVTSSLRERSVKRQSKRLGRQDAPLGVQSDQKEEVGTTPKADKRLAAQYELVARELLASRDLVPAAPPYLAPVPDGDSSQGEGSAAFRIITEAERWTEVAAVDAPLGATPFDIRWMQSGESWALSVRGLRSRSGSVTILRGREHLEWQADGSYLMTFGDRPAVAVFAYETGASLIVGTRSQQVLLQVFVKRLSVSPPSFSWEEAPRFEEVSDEDLRETMEGMASAGEISWLHALGLAARYVPSAAPRFTAEIVSKGRVPSLVMAVEGLFEELQNDAIWLESSVEPDDASWCSVANEFIWKRELLEGLMGLVRTLSLPWDDRVLVAWDEEAALLMKSLPDWDDMEEQGRLFAAAYQWLEVASQGTETPWWFEPVLGEVGGTH